MPAVANLVHQTSEGTGAGALTVIAVNGKRTFAQAFPGGTTSNAFDYFISNRQFPEWERGTGHWDGSTLVRDTVLESSNSDALVSFSAGIKDITNDVPALKQVQTDLAQTLTNKTLTSPAITSPTGLVKADVGLGDVDNTSDADKPVSTATQAALNLKADSADLAGYLDKATYDPNSVEADAFDQDNMVDGTTNKNFTATEKTKLAGIEALADVTDAANVAAAGAFMKSSDDADDITEGASHLFLTTSERSAISGLASTYQPLDSDLTAIAGLSPTNDDIVQRKAGAWTNRTMAQLATDLNLAATYQPLASALTSWAAITRASGFDTFAATPSSANLAALLTDETGTGSAVFATAPTLSDPVVGTQSAGDSSTKAASTAFVTGAIREKLTTTRTYYVRTDGSDSNNGLANTSGGAFLTIQKAIDVTAALDIGVNNVTINVTDGTYTGANRVTGPWLGKGSVTITGNTTTPANVIINPTGGTCFFVDAGGRLTINGMELRTTTSGDCLRANANGFIIMGTALRFGACAGNHIYSDVGGIVQCFSNYTISGSPSTCHVFCEAQGQVGIFPSTVTLSGTPAWGNAFIIAQTGGFCDMRGMSFSGSATGKRYDVKNGGIINSGGGGTSFYPGNSAGTGTNLGTSPYGMYI